MKAKLRDRINMNYKFFSKHYYLAYTLLFAVVCILVFMPFISANKTLLWHEDGWNQHYKALTYYGQWLRSIAKSLLFDHKLVVPMWNFSLGQGSDVITTLHYYAIGDPLNLLSIFVPAKYVYHLYDALIILRFYLSGLFFSMFCFKIKKASRFAVMVGAFTYAFGGYAVFSSVRHPYFVNPMIYLPLILIGVEKVIENKRALILTVSVCIAAMSNFYFFYMIVLVVIIYAAGRLISIYHKNVKMMLKPLLKMFLYSGLGVMLSAVILLPSLVSFLSDGRNSSEYTFHLFYPLKFYTSFAASFLAADITGGAWTFLGFSAIALPSIVLLLKRRRSNGLLKAFFVIGTVFLMFPMFGRLFNGFSYPANRWSFSYAFLIAYIVTETLPYMTQIKNKKEILHISVVIGLYGAVCFLLENSRKSSVFLSLALILGVIIYIFYNMDNKAGNRKRINAFVTFASIGSIVINSFYLYSYSESFGYVSQFEDKAQVQQKNDDTVDNIVKNTVAQNEDSGFFRYSGRNLPKNTALLNNTHNCQFFWSISNVNIFDFRYEMNMRELLAHLYEGWDDRTALDELASVRYYVVPQNDKQPLPYGYRYVQTQNVNQQKVEEIAEKLKSELAVDELSDEDKKRIDDQYANYCCLYENQYALPLGYTYDGYITRNDYENMSAVEKQEAMLQGVVLENKQDGYDRISPKLTSKKIPYRISSDNKNVIKQDNEFVVTKADSSITLTFDGVPNSETYFSVRNMSYKGTSIYNLYNDDSTFDPLNRYTKTDWDALNENQKYKIKHDDSYWQENSNLSLTLKAVDSNKKSSVKDLNYYTPDYTWYNNRKDIDVNLGYKQDAVKSITVTFPQIGVYSFDEVSVICQPMNNYEQQVTALKADSLKNVSTDNNTVTGTINLDKPKLLCLSIPYGDGWTAYVDGTKQEILKANTMYMGLALDSGKHNIKLVYQTPYLKLGACITYITLTGLIITAFISFVYKKLNVTVKKELSKT